MRTKDHHLLLHTRKIQQPVATVNIAFTLLRSTIILALIFYRASSILNIFYKKDQSLLLPWLLIFSAELLLSFFFILNQAYFWRPIYRSVFPEKLPILDHQNLPGVDVFICTADPKKEPVVEVMNTVLSSMCLNHSQHKLSVYLSDDASSPLTLFAFREAWAFARSWLPFCRKYGIETICPEAYFRNRDEYHQREGLLFMADEENIKSKYSAFREKVEKANTELASSKHDLLPVIEVINGVDETDTKMPRLVYVAREKRRDYPHHFKAGALNSLLRVSGIVSNAPYILVLDCDMYCNDPSSARQAMCFLLDPKINSSLSFVQFPQMFYSISKNDIYDGQMRAAKTKFEGMDGIQGPGLSGSAFYIKRETVYKSPKQESALSSFDLHEVKDRFGASNMFIRTLNENYDSANSTDNQELLQEAQFLASCSYEKESKWGKEIGFLYHCKLESTFTGYYLHSQGWKSVYIHPKRPCFLGCPTLNLNDKFSQAIKWNSELLRLGFSSFSPLTYGISRLPIVQNMFYAYITLSPLASIPLTFYASIPQLCFLFGIPLFPKASDPWFIVFALAFLTCFGQQFYDTRGSLRTCWNEMRIWMIMSVSSKLFGCMDAIKKSIGMNNNSLTLSNKAVSEEEIEEYARGEFNLRGTAITMFPFIILVILNSLSVILGVQRMVRNRSYDSMFGQAFLSLFPLIVGFPIVKAMLMSRNKRKA